MEVSNKGINPVFERHATLNSQINESLQKVQWRKYSLSILLVLKGPSNVRKIIHYGGCYDLCIKMAMSLNVNLDLNTCKFKIVIAQNIFSIQYMQRNAIKIVISIVQ